MGFSHEELLALIVKNQDKIAEFPLVVQELHQSYKNWTLGGVASILATIILAFPGAVILHRHLHPSEWSITEQKMKRQSKTLDRMIKETRKLQEEVGTLPKTP